MIKATPAISLVVLSYNRFEATTGACLATLQSALGDPRFEIVLVDNASRDGAAARCAEFAARHRGVRWLPLRENFGFSGGMNSGADAASGRWFCLVNSDTLFPAGALEALARTAARASDSVAMLGPTTNAAGNGQRLPLPDVPIGRVVQIGAATMAAPTGLLTPTYRTDFFCVAVRRDAWQRLGGLDRAFGLGYYEDFDFSLRLRKLGLEQVIAEDVFVAHFGSASFETRDLSQRDLMRKNRALLLERHRDARLEHARVGNAHALGHLLEVAERDGWTLALQQRAAWRLAALRWDEARRPWVRWRWRRRTRPLCRALDAAGIVPAFPA